MKEKISWHFCDHCRGQIPVLDQGYMVEEKTCRLFCSESCIVKYYDPLIDLLANDEKQYRKKNNINEKLEISEAKQRKLLSSVLEQPDEIWSCSDQLGCEYFFQIKKVSTQPTWMILVCFRFKQKPSFILHHVLTHSSQMMQYYQKGTLVTQNEEIVDDQALTNEEIIVPEKFMEQVESLRSSFLASILSKRDEQDIPIEDFHLFEEYIEPTISQPEEVFEYEDKSGHLVHAFIRDFEKMDDCFFYIVLSLKLDPTMQPAENRLDDEVFIPVLAFPTIDEQLYLSFKKGICLTRKAVN